MPNIMREGKEYSGHVVGSANEIIFNNVDTELESKNVQDAIVELNDKLSILQSYFKTPEFTGSTKEELRDFLIREAMGKPFGMFSIKGTTQLLGMEGNFIGIYFSDEISNYTFLIRNHWNTHTWIGSFDMYSNPDTNLKIYKVNTDSSEAI